MTTRPRSRLHHQRRHGADNRRFCHAAFTMAGEVVHDFAATSGMADMHRVLEVKMSRQRRKIVGVVIHVVAVADLARTAVAAPVMRDDAVPWSMKNSIGVSQSSDESGQPWLNTMGCPDPSPYKKSRCRPSR
jgi:hypothetical protein